MNEEMGSGQSSTLYKHSQNKNFQLSICFNRFLQQSKLLCTYKILYIDFPNYDTRTASVNHSIKLFPKRIFQIPGFDKVSNQTTTIYTQVKGTWTKWKKRFIVDEEHFPPKSHRFTAVYSRDKEYLWECHQLRMNRIVFYCREFSIQYTNRFDVHHPSFFTAAIRSRIVKFILDRIRFSIDMSDAHAFGIDRLISDEAYIAAYPLHDVRHNQIIVFAFSSIRLFHYREKFGPKAACATCYRMNGRRSPNGIATNPLIT